MRGLAARTLVGALASSALACSVLTDFDGLTSKSGTEPDETETETATETPSAASGSKPEKPSKPPKSSSSTSSGGDDDDDVPPPNGDTFLNEDFAAGCGAWTVTGPGTVTAATETNSGAPGSCQLCATGDGDVFLERTASAPRAGKAAIALFARRSSAEAPTSASFGLRAGGSNSTVSKNVGAGFTSLAFTGISGMSVTAGANVTARVGMTKAAAGYCIVVDDIVMTLK